MVESARRVDFSSLIRHYRYLTSGPRQVTVGAFFLAVIMHLNPAFGAPCSVPNCERTICSRGNYGKLLCRAHYKRLQTRGTVDADKPVRRDKPRVDPLETLRRNIERANKWRAENREHLNEWSRNWVAKNRNRRNEINRKYMATRAAYYKAACAQRKKALRQATPPWLTHSDFAEWYGNTPDGHHVDHIIALQAKNVCGLHVPWNLQYLPHSENCAKQNRFDEQAYLAEYPTTLPLKYTAE